MSRKPWQAVRLPPEMKAKIVIEKNNFPEERDRLHPALTINPAKSRVSFGLIENEKLAAGLELDIQTGALKVQDPETTMILTHQFPNPQVKTQTGKISSNYLRHLEQFVFALEIMGAYAPEVDGVVYAYGENNAVVNPQNYSSLEICNLILDIREQISRSFEPRDGEG